MVYTPTKPLVKDMRNTSHFNPEDEKDKQGYSEERDKEDPVEEAKQEEMLKEAIALSNKRDIILPEEPTSDNTDSLELVFRLPVSGDKIKRRFLKTDDIALLYDFIDDLHNKDKC